MFPCTLRQRCTRSATPEIGRKHAAEIQRPVLHRVHDRIPQSFGFGSGVLVEPDLVVEIAAAELADNVMLSAPGATAGSAVSILRAKDSTLFSSRGRAGGASSRLQRRRRAFSICRGVGARLRRQCFGGGRHSHTLGAVPGRFCSRPRSCCYASVEDSVQCQ